MMSDNTPKKPTKKNPSPFGDLMNSMNDFFHERPVKGILQSIDEFFQSPFPGGMGGFPVELEESSSEHIVKVQLPGVKRDQINIDVFQQYVTISVKNTKLFTQENEDNKIIQRKQSMQRTTRTIPLPSLIDDQNASASYEDGLLVLKLPKIQGKKLNLE
jgi:HSP20 family protein